MRGAGGIGRFFMGLVMFVGGGNARSPLGWLVAAGAGRALR
jgi:hypothetical protein